MKNIRVFEVAEDEWIAAETDESAVECYKQLAGADTYDEISEEFGAPVELTEEQMKRIMFHGEGEGPVSFFDQLAKLMSETADFPQFFATGNI